MSAYIIRWVWLTIPTLFFITLIIFFTMRLIPGDAVDALVARLVEGMIEPEDIAAMRASVMARLGLDVPVHISYFRWLGVLPGADGSFSGLLQGDLGGSFWHPGTVLKQIAVRWPITFRLGVIAFLIAQLIAFPIGIYSALRQDTWGDYVGRSFALVWIAVPGFWVAIMVIVMPAIWWGYMIPIMHIHPFHVACFHLL